MPLDFRTSAAVLNFVNMEVASKQLKLSNNPIDNLSTLYGLVSGVLEKEQIKSLSAEEKQEVLKLASSALLQTKGFDFEPYDGLFSRFLPTLMGLDNRNTHTSAGNLTEARDISISEENHQPRDWRADTRQRAVDLLNHAESKDDINSCAILNRLLRELPQYSEEDAKRNVNQRLVALKNAGFAPETRPLEFLDPSEVSAIAQALSVVKGSTRAKEDIIFLGRIYNFEKQFEARTYSREEIQVELNIFHGDRLIGTQDGKLFCTIESSVSGSQPASAVPTKSVGKTDSSEISANLQKIINELVGSNKANSRALTQLVDEWTPKGLSPNQANELRSIIGALQSHERTENLGIADYRDLTIERNKINDRLLSWSRDVLPNGSRPLQAAAASSPSFNEGHRLISSQESLPEPPNGLEWVKNGDGPTYETYPPKYEYVLTRQPSIQSGISDSLRRQLRNEIIDGISQFVDNPRTLENFITTLTERGLSEKQLEGLQMILARVIKLKRDSRMGLLSFSDENVTRNQIVSSLLEWPQTL